MAIKLKGGGGGMLNKKVHNNSFNDEYLYPSFSSKRTRTVHKWPQLKVSLVKKS